MGDAKQARAGLARLMFTGSIACGIIGLVAGITDKAWKLDATGRFAGGLLLAALAIVVLADQFVSSRTDST